MMRYLRYGFWFLVALCLIPVAFANRQNVTLNLLPETFAEPLGMRESITLPLFAVIFTGLAVGLLIGFLWEWVREYRLRAESTRKEQQLRRLEREVARLKGEKNEGKDEVLALLEDVA